MDETPRIPPDFDCEYEERPFRHCTRCGETLIDDLGGYHVSKAYRNGECVMEYALCHHCRNAMMEEFSSESKQRLADYQDGHVHLDRGLEQCSVCDRSGEGLDDYVITGLCSGDRLQHALLICGDCAEGVQHLLSQPTKDTWRRFVDENFPGPPGEGVEPEIESLPALPVAVARG